MEAKYTLPKGHGSIAEKFDGLCQTVENDYIPTIREHIEAAIETITLFKDDYLGPNIGLAQSIGDTCNFLLDRYPEASKEKQKLIIGAIRYFVVHMDSLPDVTPLIGLDDDKLVLNHVLEKLGHKDKFLE